MNKYTKKTNAEGGTPTSRAAAREPARQHGRRREWQAGEEGGKRGPGTGAHRSCTPGGAQSTLDKPPATAGGTCGRGHEPGTCGSRFLLIWSLSICNFSPSPFHLLLVSWCLFFLRPCGLTFQHSYRERHPRLFSYGNIYLLYIYIFCKSHKVRQTQLVRKENTCKRFHVPLHPATWIIGSCCSLALAGEEKRKKKMLLKKIK